MDRNGDHDGKSKTSSAVDGKHYPDVESQEDHLLPAHSEIATLAHQIWLEQGRPTRSAESDWLEAERRLMADRRPSSPETQQGLASSSGTVQR
jgi:Protein of unknown function (DUF2934)